MAFPTETVYGLADRHGDRAARERLRRLKGRETGKPFQHLVSSRRKAFLLCAAVPAAARRLAKAHWPGPLTLVVKARNGRWLGLRVPDHPVALSLTRRAGGILVATSANRSGTAPAKTAAEVRSAFGDRVALVLAGGRASVGEPSTVVRVGRDGVEVLREGAISRAEIMATAGLSQGRKGRGE